MVRGFVCSWVVGWSLDGCFVGGSLVLVLFVLCLLWGVFLCVVMEKIWVRVGCGVLGIVGQITLFLLLSYALNRLGALLNFQCYLLIFCVLMGLDNVSNTNAMKVSITFLRRFGGDGY